MIEYERKYTVLAEFSLALQTFNSEFQRTFLFRRIMTETSVPILEFTETICGSFNARQRDLLLNFLG
jgi:hypothetical protein